MIMEKILIITSCTSKKRFQLQNQLTHDDFLDKKILCRREKELSNYILPAAEMYTGTQHLQLLEGVSALRNSFGKDIVDLFIVSAGYGLISETKPIAPYEVTFNNMDANDTISWARFLKIHEDLERLLRSESYKCVFFLLGSSYLRALEFPVRGSVNNERFIFLAGKTSFRYIPDGDPYYVLEVEKKEAQAFGYGLVGLKGFLFKLFAYEIQQEGISLLDRVYENPAYFFTVIDKYRKHKNDKSLHL